MLTFFFGPAACFERLTSADDDETTGDLTGLEEERERERAEGERGRGGEGGREGGREGGADRGQVAPVREDLEQKDLRMGLT
jgi:hypothetical protein